MSPRPSHPLAGGRSVAEDELWTFPEGLIGVPGRHRFALLPIEGAPPFEILCSAEDGFGLVLVNPAIFVPDYELSLSRGDLFPLGIESPDAVEIRVPVLLPTEGQPLSLNLKGPVLLAPGVRRGIQRISSEESHAVRFTPQLPDPAACSS